MELSRTLEGSLQFKNILDLPTLIYVQEAFTSAWKLTCLVPWPNEALTYL